MTKEEIIKQEYRSLLAEIPECDTKEEVVAELTKAISDWEYESRYKRFCPVYRFCDTKEQFIEDYGWSGDYPNISGYVFPYDEEAYEIFKNNFDELLEEVRKYALEVFAKYPNNAIAEAMSLCLGNSISQQEQIQNDQLELMQALSNCRLKEIEEKFSEEFNYDDFDIEEMAREGKHSEEFHTPKEKIETMTLEELNILFLVNKRLLKSISEADDSLSHHTYFFDSDEVWDELYKISDEVKCTQQNIIDELQKRENEALCEKPKVKSK